MTIYFVTALLVLLKAGPAQVIFNWKYTDEWIVQLLTPGGCGNDEDGKRATQDLIETRDRAFPAYRRILNDPKTKDVVRG